MLSCNKTVNTPDLQDVKFNASASTLGLKASSCDNPAANFALIEIDGDVYQTDVFYLNEKIYTTTFKLAPGIHTISMFVLVNDGGTPDNPDGDVIVQATPLSGNTYANFISKPLPFDFTVSAFTKTEVPIEVLCYDAAEYENFGFAWFSLEEIVVREICFFGDFCTEDYLDYAGSLYEYQRNGLQHDMPAIFKIDVIRNGDTLITYSNADWLGEGRPLCVQYPDYSNFTDHFEFVLSILVKEGESFVYKQFYTWTSTDAEGLPDSGDDNIMDFVLGDCVPDADLILPPYTDPTSDPNTSYGCETAFGYGGIAYASCFITDGFGNWGWTNGKYNFGTFKMDLVAAAGGCDQTKGFVVGEVVLSYLSNGNVQITYNAFEGFNLTGVHIYVGYTKYPLNNTTPTVAPGQYTAIADGLPSNTRTYTFNLSNYTQKIYVIAHADVCGNYPNQ